MPANTSTPAPQPLSAVFPSSLDGIAAEEQIPQVLSYLPLAFGVVAILIALAILSFPAYIPVRSSPPAMALVAALLLVGPLLIRWDYKRHPNPPVLVRRLDLVAIYRNRALDQTLPISAIRPYKLKRFNTAILVVSAILVGPLLTYSGLQTYRPVGPHAPPFFKLTAMMAGVTLFWVSSAFFAFERLTTWTFSLYYKAPGDKNFTMDTLALSRPNADRLFPKNLP